MLKVKIPFVEFNVTCPGQFFKLHAEAGGPGN